MRALVGVIAIVGIVGAIVVQKQREAAQPQASEVKPATVVTAKAAPAAAPVQPTAQHWPKRALDRAADVKRQVADQRKGDEAR